VQAPVDGSADAIGRVVRSQMPNRLFRFTSRNAQLMITFTAGTTPETFRDVSGDRLCRFPQLLNMNQTPRTTVDEAIDFIRDRVSRIEYREVAMVCHAPRVQRIGE